MSARILVVSPNETASDYMKDFFERIEGMRTPDFVIGKFVPADKYDFIVYDCRMAPTYKIEDYIKLPDEVQAHFSLLDRYIQDTNKYIVFFGRYYHNLNYERCPSANSKFTLYARMKELMDFLNNYRSA
jgi:hypothetical protein